MGKVHDTKSVNLHVRVNVHPFSWIALGSQYNAWILQGFGIRYIVISVYGRMVIWSWIVTAFIKEITVLPSLVIP